MLYYRYDQHTPHWRADRKDDLADAICALVESFEREWCFAPGTGPYVDTWDSVTIRKIVELSDADLNELVEAADALYSQIMIEMDA